MGESSRDHGTCRAGQQRWVREVTGPAGQRWVRVHGITGLAGQGRATAMGERGLILRSDSPSDASASITRRQRRSTWPSASSCSPADECPVLIACWPSTRHLRRSSRTGIRVVLDPGRAQGQPSASGSSTASASATAAGCTGARCAFPWGQALGKAATLKEGGGGGAEPAGIQDLSSRRKRVNSTAWNIT
ncbi:hypothetical protein B296_00057753 [Ensete ventricosum]|uniref:Uncharacterized protein n=1 Tax=Ensete ventricosum TaxID=4639 RepID=A0A426WXL0_ENSVE|nr:hypothetical protein B296_00057753 [Ensete ventricosum]